MEKWGKSVSMMLSLVSGELGLIMNPDGGPKVTAAESALSMYVTPECTFCIDVKTIDRRWLKSHATYHWHKLMDLSQNIETQHDRTLVTAGTAWGIAIGLFMDCTRTCDSAESHFLAQSMKRQIAMPGQSRL